jgi:hypothetical protein
MDIKRKTCDIRTWRKHLFLDISSTNIDTLVPSLYQCAEPAAQKCFDCCLNHFRTWSCHHLRLSNVFENISRPSCERFTWQISFALSPFAHKNAQQAATFRYTSKHGRHYGHWNRPVNLSMRVCYLDCHEAGMCCYLVIHRENLLRPL